MSTKINPLYLLSLLLLSSCGYPEKEVSIDNPSEEQLILVLDETEIIKVPPQEIKVVKTKYGPRKMQINSITVVDIDLDPEATYLLNPLREEYWLEEFPLFYSERAALKYRDTYGPQISNIDGLELNGNFKQIKDQYVIRKQWDFGPDEKTPESLRVKSNTKNGFLRFKKLHRKRDVFERIRANVVKQLEQSLE